MDDRHGPARLGAGGVDRGTASATDHEKLALTTADLPWSVRVFHVNVKNRDAWGQRADGRRARGAARPARAPGVSPR